MKVKGYASLIGLVCMIVVSLCIGIFSMQMGKVYTSKCYSQTTADAVANSVASYASLGSNYDATKAEYMYNKLESFYSDYTLSMDKSLISSNHIVITATRDITYPWGGGTTFWSPFFRTGVDSVTSSADVELVPQAQLAKIKSAFPADKTLAITPFIKGDPSKVLTNDYVFLDTLISQFFTEGRNRYRFTGEQPTVYGTMDAYHLLIGDVLTALGYTPHMGGFSPVGIGSTHGSGTDKPLTDGYIYIGSFKGHDYIVSNTGEESQVTLLYLDDTKEEGMSKQKVNPSEISNLRRSPTKWYSPKNETEKKKEENTTTFF